MEILSELLGLAEGGANGSKTLFYLNFRRLGGVIFVFMLIFFNNCYVVWATSTLPHYHTKKCVEWRIARKKYNIYYVYNYILPQEPLKIADFRKVCFEQLSSMEKKFTHKNMW